MLCCFPLIVLIALALIRGNTVSYCTYISCELDFEHLNQREPYAIVPGWVPQEADPEIHISKQEDCGGSTLENTTEGTGRKQNLTGNNWAAMPLRLCLIQSLS